MRIVLLTKITSTVSMNTYKTSFNRRFSSFQNKFIKNKEIIYRNNVDIVCKSHIFFCTILNVDGYKHFLPYVTDSKITEKAERHFKAILQIENILFKEKYNSIIKFNYPTTITVSSEDSKLFNHLITRWIIKEKQNCINVDFYINFRLKNIIYQNFMNLYIKELGKKILYAFIKESQGNNLKNMDDFFPNLIKK
ncbi:coenzyme Q-binding protein COQ10 homolog, mitochondrial, putative [Plasmodium malariae]|uniref:Coenzyme Q-binding protein COQ10 homolog, mitochondrial, putative n=1 Tax=Plasmodium malariae TaxID=5858 RepID=A0A1C3KL95_PLAMA|nr:coenzyme Q-binding protein COQ10 homolog, mitochondrial, putative [Plasmodium malariae]